MTTNVLPEASERTEIEPTESTAAPPPAGKPDKPAGPSRTGRVLRATRTGLVALIIVGGAAAGGTYMVKQKVAASHYVALDRAVLAADAVPVGSAGAGTVTDLLVSERGHVAAGDTLARVTMSAVAVGPNGVPKPPVVVTLRAPISGTVSEVNVAQGGVVQAGEPIVTLYDEGKLTFQAKVSPDQLRLLRLGMTAKVTGPGLDHSLPAKLDHVVPRVGTDTTAPTSDKLTVVLVPAAGAMTTVTSLVPGLEYKATIDTKTAVGNTSAVNSAR